MRWVWVVPLLPTLTLPFPNCLQNLTSTWKLTLTKKFNFQTPLDRKGHVWEDGGSRKDLQLIMLFFFPVKQVTWPPAGSAEGALYFV